MYLSWKLVIFPNIVYTTYNSIFVRPFKGDVHKAPRVVWQVEKSSIKIKK